MEGIFIKKTTRSENLPPAVFIHGDIRNHTIFKEIEEFMQNRGHSTLLFDLPGHGLSKFSEDVINLPNLLEQVLIENNIKKPIIIGHSCGGTLAVEYATRTKNVHSLVIMNALFVTPKIVHPALNWEKMGEDYLKLSLKNFQKQELVDYSSLPNPNEDNISTEGLRTTDPKGLKNNMDFYTDINNKDIFNLCIPILMLTSKNDSYAPPSYAIDCLKRLKNARLCITKGGHNSIITHKKEILKKLEENYTFLIGQ
jgi:pimeloyl-ACP methyl ester carboxylesterase